jgi:hypothetical protein
MIEWSCGCCQTAGPFAMTKCPPFQQTDHWRCPSQTLVARCGRALITNFFSQHHCEVRHWYEFPPAHAPPIRPCFFCVLTGGVPANPSGPVLRAGHIRHLVQPAHRGLCCRAPAPPHERDHSVQGRAHHTDWNTSGLHWRRHTSTITSPEGPVSSGTSTMHRLTEQG